jgi:hypothetical protein
MQEYIKYKLVTSSLVKNELAYLIMILSSWTIEIFLYYFIITIIHIDNFWIKYLAEIGLSIFLSLNSFRIIGLLEPYQPTIFYGMAKDIVNNFTLEYFNNCKRAIIFTICSSSLIFLYNHEITSYYASIYIIQYMIIFIVIDQSQENSRMYGIIKKLKNKPKVKMHHECKIIEVYF